MRGFPFWKNFWKIFINEDFGFKLLPGDHFSTSPIYDRDKAIHTLGGTKIIMGMSYVGKKNQGGNTGGGLVFSWGGRGKNILDFFS